MDQIATVYAALAPVPMVTWASFHFPVLDPKVIVTLNFCGKGTAFANSLN